LVGMTHRAEYKPYELSSGEQQRISLARSLMSEPSLIIADEPTGNLDVKSGVKVMDILKDFSKNGKTVLMVTHNPEYFEYADRVLFMLDGRIRKDIKVKDVDVNDMKIRIVEDIEAFISETKENETQGTVKGPTPIAYQEDSSKHKGRERFIQILDSLKFVTIFTFSMFLLVLVYVPAYILEKLFFRKSNLSSKASDFITNIFNKLESEKKGVQASISSWDLGEISLGHLMEKKSRTLITILGVGVGIGFITFLLSLGYGLENLVVEEIAEIEEMRQVNISPVVGSEVLLDDERYEIISTTPGVTETYPLINIATTIFYEDSQTDLVAYGIEPEYLSVTRADFLKGSNFDKKKQEIIIGEEVLKILDIDGDSIIGQKLALEFIPVDEEESVISEEDENVAGVYDDRVEYIVAGIVANGSSPVIFFPLEDAMELGISNYSETLAILSDSADMASVRREIETLGMKTESVMDTVSQVESFFGYLRIGLLVLGGIAFLVAILGMINTLTVSLMERTREVGLLKSIGMRSGEVRKLFITESMLIAFFGGVSGVLMGAIMGVIISFILSGISISQGGEFLAISKIPIYLVAVVIFASVLIGFITGLYPSRRAVKMSPLDALRYE